MAEAHLAALVGRRVSLPGHFDTLVILEDVRPLGAEGSTGYECRVRLPDGALDEAVISAEEAAAIAAAVSRPEKVGKRPKRHGPRTRSLPDGASAADAWTRRLTRSVSEAWRVLDRAAGLPSRVTVTPAAPILFFGDLAAYRASPLRVLTVGLNPSLHEFPDGNPFQRFPLLNGGSTDREPNRYLAVRGVGSAGRPGSGAVDDPEPREAFGLRQAGSGRRPVLWSPRRGRGADRSRATGGAAMNGRARAHPGNHLRLTCSLTRIPDSTTSGPCTPPLPRCRRMLRGG